MSFMLEALQIEHCPWETRAFDSMKQFLTWNCRHIANAAIVEDVRAVCAKAGHPAPVICTPLELMV